MSDPLLLTFNPGSSTIKFGLFRIHGGTPVHLGKGAIDLRGDPLALELSRDGQSVRIQLRARLTDDLHEVIDETLAWFSTHFSLRDFASVGHRVVHGGDRFAGPAAIDDETLAEIEALVPLAPLHQPQCVRLIRAIRALRPHLPQCASFDTAFHHRQSDLVRRFAIARHLFDAGIKRYGFHGLSYQFIASRLAQAFPQVAAGKVVVAHLGSGASLCALDAGVSRDTSMGFSTLDGVPMATRCGALDAGVVLHLLGERDWKLADVERLLYHESGLLGVSGVSADSRTLLESTLPQAREAIDLFAFRIAGEIARLATSLGGLDALVFTAGIGEHQPEIRAAICERLAWLGVTLDPQTNGGNAQIVSSAKSCVAVLVIPTDEEQIIAQDAVSILHRLAPAD
ncbi:acetate/propionate family kinase [Trinickia sp. Y13]|uniref:acetate/propionate family kinase n=1 Tax=Trinickia sp. Y13 TaxID=2917807 RepID=UPI0024056F8F|nr:acetate/propionate family kinase [Trinickia sp. Y13]MDG0027821.1 acetate/propionate family kinase [Trinickia sp. Y13]